MMRILLFIFTIVSVYNNGGAVSKIEKGKSSMGSRDLKLNLKESIELDDGLKLHFDSATIEEIAANPHDSKSYPAGSGVTIQLKAEKNGKSELLYLSELSPGYDSTKEISWGAYQFLLQKINEPGTDRMSIELRVNVKTPALFQNLNREQMIIKAKSELEKTLGKIDLADFPQTKVFRKSDAFRVCFSSPLSSSPTPGQETSINVWVYAETVEVQPKNRKSLYIFTDEMRRLLKSFNGNDSLTVEDKGQQFQVTVSHPGGGAEAYVVEKKTFAKSMLWHEHPQPKNRSSSPNDKVLTSITGEAIPAADDFIEVN
jgi:hypothetical protein